MKLIQAELKKIFSSKIICILLFVLLAVNFALTLYTSRPQPYEKTVREVYAKYIEDPEPYDEYYKELELLAMLNIREETPNLPYTYYGTADFNDYSILSSVYERRDYLEVGQSAQINKIISMTKRKIDDLYGFNYDDNSYEVKSQKALLARYENLLENTDLGDEYTYGYDVYLKNNTVSVFILLFICAAVSYIFLNDKSVGFESVLRISKKGRLPTFGAKIAAAMIITVLCTLLFLATTFAATGIIKGFSSAAAPIQSLSVFATVPYAVSIFEYTLMHTALRIVGFSVFAMFIAVLACLKLPYVFCYGIGALGAGANVFLCVREYIGTSPPIRYVNFAALIEACGLLGFYRTFSFFGIVTEYPIAILFISFIVCGIFIAVCAFFYCKNIRLFHNSRMRIAKLSEKIKKLYAKSGKQSKIKKGKILPLGIYELKKSRALLSLAAIVILLLAKGAYVNETIGTMESYSEAIYYEYITEIKPLDEISRSKYMSEERSRIDAIVGVAEEKKTAYEKRELESSDYFEYLEVLSKTKSEDLVFGRVEQYVDYINAKNTATGLDGKVIYTTGYEKFFELSPDIFLYAALIILCANCFTVEYGGTVSQGGFSKILRTTKRGRKQTFIAKFATYCALGGLISLAFRALTLIAVKKGYILADIGATLYSVKSFSPILSGITIKQYLIFDFALQFLTGILIAALICCLSFFCKKILTVLSVTVLLSGIPEVLTQTVLKNMPFISILSLTSPQNLVCRSAEKQLFGADFAHFTLVYLAWTAINTALIITARKKFCGVKNLKSRRKNYEA